MMDWIKKERKERDPRDPSSCCSEMEDRSWDLALRCGSPKKDTLLKLEMPNEFMKL